MKLKLLMLLVFVACTMNAQRFSLLLEAGGLRTQIDGDRINGFNYTGYNMGIGSYYTFTPQHFLAVKSSFYKQGSRRENEFEPRLRTGFQLEVDIQTIGVELSYKYEPMERPYFLGAGLVRHQLVGVDYEIIDIELREETRRFEADQLRSGFNSFKCYFGYNLFDRAGLYVSFESAVSDLLRNNFHEIHTLTPYSVSAVFTYEILAAQEVKMKTKPGSKSRVGKSPRRRQK